MRKDQSKTGSKTLKQNYIKHGKARFAAYIMTANDGTANFFDICQHVMKKITTSKNHLAFQWT